MALSTTMLQSDMDFILADLPQTMTWSGSSYSAVITDINSEDDLEIAGIMETNTFSVIISLDDFTTYPDTGDRITISSKSYRVLGYSDSPDGITRTLTCGGDLQ